MFAAEEAFQIAPELEQTGEVFHEAIAAGCGNDTAADLCRRLASQERKHCRRFRQMRQAVLAGAASAPTTWEQLGCAQGTINQRMTPDPKAAAEIAGRGGLGDMPDPAVQPEADSVRFYCDLVRAADPPDADAVGHVLAEGQRHQQELTLARGNLP